jgi:hypothetical protein
MPYYPLLPELLNLSQGGTSTEPKTEPDETESIGAMVFARAAIFVLIFFILKD